MRHQSAPGTEKRRGRGGSAHQRRRPVVVCVHRRGRRRRNMILPSPLPPHVAAVLLALILLLVLPPPSDAQSCETYDGRAAMGCPPQCGAAVYYVRPDGTFITKCRTPGTKSFCDAAMNDKACFQNSGCSWTGRRCDLDRNAVVNGAGGAVPPGGGGPPPGVPPGGGGGAPPPSQQGPPPAAVETQGNLRPGSRKYCKKMGASDAACGGLDGCRWTGRRCTPDRTAAAAGGGVGVGSVGGGGALPPPTAGNFGRPGSRKYCRLMGENNEATCNGLEGCGWDAAGRCKRAGAVKTAASYEEGSNNYCRLMGDADEVACGNIGCTWVVQNNGVGKCKRTTSSGAGAESAAGGGGDAAGLPQQQRQPCSQLLDEGECNGTWNCAWKTENSRCAQERNVR